jgi:hypothetical protein
VTGFGLAVAVGVTYPSVDDPILVGIQIDMQAVGHADAFHDAMLVAAMLAADPLYFGGMALVQDGIVGYQAGIPAAADEVRDGLPYHIR